MYPLSPNKLCARDSASGSATNEFRTVIFVGSSYVHILCILDKLHKYIVSLNKLAFSGCNQRHM